MGGVRWRVLEVMRRVLFCMLEAIEGELCLLEVPEVLGLLEISELSFWKAAGRALSHDGVATAVISLDHRRSKELKIEAMDEIKG